MGTVGAMVCLGVFAVGFLAMIFTAMKGLLGFDAKSGTASAGARDEVPLQARWRGRCTTCNGTVAEGDGIYWHKHHRTVRHQNCQQGQQRARSVLVASTLERLEAAKGPAARRNALTAALAELPQGPERHQLMLEASRIEVEAVLTKVDSLKTPSAKRRHLEAAIAKLKADELPDELQGEELRWLEAALAELDQ